MAPSSRDKFRALALFVRQVSRGYLARYTAYTSVGFCMRGTDSVPRLVYCARCYARYVFRTSIVFYARGTFSVPRLALPCSKTDCDCTAIFLPSNLTLNIKSAEIMCCTHILILSSKGNTPCYYSMSVVVRGTYSVPRLLGATLVARPLSLFRLAWGLSTKADSPSYSKYLLDT